MSDSFILSTTLSSSQEVSCHLPESFVWSSIHGLMWFDTINGKSLFDCGLLWASSWAHVPCLQPHRPQQLRLAWLLWISTYTACSVPCCFGTDMDQVEERPTEEICKHKSGFVPARQRRPHGIMFTGLSSNVGLDIIMGMNIYRILTVWKDRDK